MAKQTLPQLRPPAQRPPRPVVPQFPPAATAPTASTAPTAPTAPEGAPGADATQEQMNVYLLQQLAHQQQLNTHQQQLNTHQQQLNTWAMAKFEQVDWDNQEIHHKFNMREAMEKYEEVIFRLLEFDNCWSLELSGIPPPTKLADISYLRGQKYANKKAQVNAYLTGFSSFTKYFADLDSLLGSMRQWSEELKKPATRFSHNDHPRPGDMPEMHR
jgi:hypothetical protein